MEKKQSVPEQTPYQQTRRTKMVKKGIRPHQMKEETILTVSLMKEKKFLNQTLAEKKSNERYNKLSKTLRDSKKSLDTYKETNDKVVKKIQSEVSNTAKDLKTLQEQVKGPQSEINDANEKLDVTQKLLEDTRSDLNLKSEIVDKLGKKYEKEEDELKRCLLLIDGVKEHGNKKPMAVVENLMKDLGFFLKIITLRGILNELYLKITCIGMLMKL